MLIVLYKKGIRTSDVLQPVNKGTMVSDKVWGVFLRQWVNAVMKMCSFLVARTVKVPFIHEALHEADYPFTLLETSCKKVRA